MTQRRWIKIWHEVLTDDDLHDLDMASQGRYYNLLVYVSAHGKNGALKIKPPARSLVNLLQCEDFSGLTRELLVLKSALKNMEICNGEKSVTTIIRFKKWHKYQKDSSAERVRKHREKVTVQDKIRKEKEKDIREEIVFYLNEKLGTNYRPSTKSTVSHISARLADGFTVENFKTVIDKKAAQWQKNPEMVKYLRPETLFGTKFESYLNEPGAPKDWRE